VASQYRSLQDQGTLKLHQLWFLKHRDAASEEQRVQGRHRRSRHRAGSRLADLRHVEAELETVRQAHYAANDVLHAKQGLLGEAALEVSRLEERIRYVVEGRQRAQQRLADLQAQNAQWASARTGAHPSWKTSPARSWPPTSRPSC
jgi:chromosome segregation protein